MTLLSPAQVAERLGVPRSSVLMAIRRRDLAAIDIGVGRPYYRVAEDDLEAYITSRRRPAL